MITVKMSDKLSAWSVLEEARVCNLCGRFVYYGSKSSPTREKLVTEHLELEQEEEFLLLKLGGEA